jgi:competence protein ComEA
MDAFHRRRALFPYIAVAVLVLLLALRALGGGGGAAAGPSVAIDGAAGDTRANPGGDTTRRSRERVWVHVAGAVRRPGLYRVAADARAGEAVEAAGGVARRADLRAVNLASTIRDGQQIIVPARGEAAAAPAAGGAALPAGAEPASGAKLSLATATVEQLDTLDGIGPTLAKRIVEWRDANGGFKSIEQLREVDGIGEKRFESLRAAVEP